MSRNSLPKRRTESGIVIPNSSAIDKCRVLAIGSEVKDVNVGDLLIVNWSKVYKALEDFVVSEDEVYAILDYDVDKKD